MIHIAKFFISHFCINRKSVQIKLAVDTKLRGIINTAEDQNMGDNEEF